MTVTPYRLKDWVKQAQERLQDLEARVDRQIAHEEQDPDASRDHLTLPIIDCIAPLLLFKQHVRS